MITLKAVAGEAFTASDLGKELVVGKDGKVYKRKSIRDRFLARVTEVVDKDAVFDLTISVKFKDQPSERSHRK